MTGSETMAAKEPPPTKYIAKFVVCNEMGRMFSKPLHLALAIVLLVGSSMSAIALSLEAALRNNPRLAKFGEEAIKEQIEAIDDLCWGCQDSSAIRESVFKAGFTMLVIHGAGVGDMERLAPGFRDYLAATKGFNATEADAQMFMDQIARAIKSGHLNGWGHELSFSDDEVRQFKHSGSAKDHTILFNKKLEELYGGQGQALARSPAGIEWRLKHAFDHSLCKPNAESSVP